MKSDYKLAAEIVTGQAVKDSVPVMVLMRHLRTPWHYGFTWFRRYRLLRLLNNWLLRKRHTTLYTEILTSKKFATTFGTFCHIGSKMPMKTRVGD